MAGAQPSVSALYVVTGSPELLGFSLQSVLPAVSEVIMVATAPVPQVADIARQYGARLIPAPDAGADPAALRQQALAHAGGDWVLQMEADRIFYPDLARFLPDLLCQAQGNAFLVSEYRFHRDFWHVENDGDRDPVCTIPLLLRRTAAAGGGAAARRAGLAHSGLVCADYGALTASAGGTVSPTAPEGGAELPAAPAGRALRPFTREHPPVMRAYLAGRQPRPVPWRTGLFLTTFNDLTWLPACLDSLKPTLGPNHRLVAVDMGSTDGTVPFLADQGVPTLTLPGDNLAAALNLGLRHFLADPETNLLGWVHPDMLFTSGWLERLADVLADAPAIGKLVPRNIQSPEEWARTDWSAVMDADRAVFMPGNGCPWLMHRATVEATGLFDEGYQACGGYEDWDHNNTLLRAGYRVGYTHASVVYHCGMGSRKRRPENFSEWARQNAGRYHRKWGTYAPQV